MTPRRRDRRRRTAVAALSALALLCACHSTRRAPDPRAAGRGAADAELPGDPEIERDLETINVRTTDGDRERVLEFDLRNRTSRKLAFAFAVEWYDRAGRRIAAADRAWIPMTLDPEASRPVKVVMPSPEAGSWRLRAVQPEKAR